MEKSLSENINNSIQAAGGRIALAAMIIRECPEWFTALEAKYFTDRDKGIASYGGYSLNQD